MQDNLARKLPRQEPQRKPATRKKAKRQKFRWKFAIMSIIYFAAIMLVIGGYSRINELEREIALAKNEFEEIESQNISKKVDIQASINMEEIEKIATEKLGMIKPGQNQIVGIDVILNDEANMLAPEPTQGVFAKALSGIEKIISYLH